MLALGVHRVLCGVRHKASAVTTVRVSSSGPSGGWNAVISLLLPSTCT
jgi:hypothetical protein